MATKVFVDLDEEIILAVEKVLKAEGNQIILVVPESAMLVGSLVSLKLLSRQIYKNNKMIVLVTEDETGLELSKKAGLVSVEKVSDVNGETWKKALVLREKFKEDREKLKKKLLSKREEGEEVEIEEGETIEKEEIVEKKEEPQSTEEEKGEEYFQGMPEKPRIGGKLVHIAGFSLYAGGDIEENSDNLNRNETPETEVKNEAVDREREDVKREEKNKATPHPVAVPSPVKAEEISGKEQKPQTKSSASFIGRDLTSVADLDQKRRRRVGEEGGGILDKIKTFFIKGNVRQKQYLLLGSVALIIVFLLGYFVFPRVTIEITLAEAEVPVNEDIRASLTETTADLEGYTIPAKKVELPKSSSKSTPTTGKGEIGDKAEGVVNFLNNTESDINIPAGTILTMTSNSSLKYKTKSQAIAVGVSGGVGISNDVQVVAENFGDKYNTNGTKVYSVAGYNLDDLKAQSFTNIAGGTTEEVKEVSQRDFDDLRNALVEEIQSGLLSELEALVGENQVKLDGTAKFADPKVTPSHKVGDDTDNLDMTVEIIGSLFIVNERDLTDMANHLVRQKNKLEGEFEIEDMSKLQVGTATVNGDVASFNLRLQGSIKANINEQLVKDQIKGKGFLEAVSIVKSLPDVKQTSFDYSPVWMPIKRIPTNDSRIKVVFI
ncbi:hypothetical protein JW796_01475 [Candidatus Dojkabacteria bacterium]|nr:hypothetical protein [Candidatus Dojkabacteria bacterium]